LILLDEGLRFLDNPRHTSGAFDFIGYMRACSDEMMPTVIEAINEAFQDPGLWETYYERNSEGWVDGVNQILREERIAWELIDSEMTPIGSRELHVAVVAPTLRLLTQPGWERVEAAYRSALSELASDQAPDAITDAGTALQEALVLLGAEGNALGPLITSAKRKGIILGHDRALLETVDRASTWVSADRSQLGDAHSVSSADRDDAWFTVHIVGAILLRLSAEHPRPSP
jgi:hypothetical protein